MNRHMNPLVTAVHLEPAAIAAWQREFAPKLLREAVRCQLAEDQIPQETGEVQPDGSLMLYCDLPSGRISMTVPPHQWRGQTH